MALKSLEQMESSSSRVPETFFKVDTKRELSIRCLLSVPEPWVFSGDRPNMCTEEIKGKILFSEIITF